MLRFLNSLLYEAGLLEYTGAMAATTSERPPQDEEIRPPTPEDSDDSDEEGWQDVEQSEDESQPIVGLFSEKIYPDVNAMLQETKDKHDFDLQKVQKDFGAYFQKAIEAGDVFVGVDSGLGFICLLIFGDRSGLSGYYQAGQLHSSPG